MEEIKIKKMEIKNQTDDDFIAPGCREVSIKFVVNDAKTLAKIQKLVMEGLYSEKSQN